jgi:predicted MFS family arabinose efflux permease
MGFLAVFGALGFGRFGYSAILPSMQKDLGLMNAAAGSLASWNLAGYVVSAAIGGLLASRFGPRRVVAIGSLVAAAGMLLTGISTGLVTASIGRLVTGLGGGGVLVPSVALMSAWFDVRRRGMAGGVVSSGSSLALVIAGPVVPLVIEAGGAEGWRLAWYFFAALTFLVGILTILFQRDRPQSAAARPRTARDARAGLGLKDVIRSRYAWHIGLVYMMFGFAYMVYFTFFQRRLTGDLGFSPSAAGRFFLVLGVFSIVCGALWGTISDRVGRGRALAVMCLLQAVAAALFAWWPSTTGLLLSAFLFGLTAVAVPGIVGAGCGDQFGPVLASASLGFVTIFLGIGQVLGPYLGGKLADISGSFTYSYLVAAGVFLLGALLSAVLRETGWRTAVGARQVESVRPQPVGPAPPSIHLADCGPAISQLPTAQQGQAQAQPITCGRPAEPQPAKGV